MRATVSRSMSCTVLPARLARPCMIACNRPVRVDPGMTMFTVMPKAPSSPAIVRTQLPMAARTTLLTPNPRSGVTTLVLVTATTRPNPAARMPGANACSSPCAVPTCCRTAFSMSAPCASTRNPGAGPPVLATSTCTAPSRDTKASAARSMAAGSA